MRFLGLLILLLTLSARAEIVQHEGETYNEAYERLLSVSRAHTEATKLRAETEMQRDIKWRGERTSFVFLKRDGDDPYTSLSTSSLGGLTQSSCQMSSATGAIEETSHFKLRALGNGEFEISPKSPKPGIRLLSFANRRVPEPDARWKIHPNPDGTFEVCSADDKQGLAGCKHWTIATIENVDTTTFIQGRGDKHKIAANDLTQGGLGTCTLWAAVHSILEARGPDEIEKLFSPGEVTFPGKAPIPVGDQFLFYWNPKDPDRKTPIGAEFGDTDRAGRQESWPVLLEKAYTIWKRSLKKADSGAFAPSVLSLMTNEKVKTYYFHPFQSKDGIFDCLKAANDDHQPMVCGSRSDLKEDNEHGILSSHAYAISKVKDGAEPSVVLIDPHGKTVELPAAEFFKHFAVAAHTVGEKGPIRQAFDAQVDKVWR